MQKLSSCHWIIIAILTLFCQSAFAGPVEAAFISALHETTWRNPDLATVQFAARELGTTIEANSKEQTNIGSGGDNTAAISARPNELIHLLRKQNSTAQNCLTDKSCAKLWLLLQSLLL